MITFVTAENFGAEVTNAAVPVLADFYSESCIPCKRLSPILYDLDTEYNGKVKIVKINAGTGYELAKKYGVTSTPTLLLLQSGAETGRLTGFVPKEEIEKLINEKI